MLHLLIGSGAVVAEWSKALHFRKKENENQMMPGSSLDLANFKTLYRRFVN